jgi:hypothetical protein
VTVSVLGELELGSYLLAVLLQVRILVAPTIVILLLGRAVLDLVICVTAIEAKVVGSLVSLNFLFRNIGIRGRFLGLVGLQAGLGLRSRILRTRVIMLVI